MAATTKKTHPSSRAGSAERETTVQLNALIGQFDALLAKLDADVGVTDVNYASTLGATAAKVGNAAGTALS